MTQSSDFTHVAVFPHLYVQNANAISSPLTHGFPAVSAFIGLMLAFQRKANAVGLDVKLTGVGVVCHRHHEQTYRGGFTQSFRLTRNPIQKDGSVAAIVEEGRIHLELSIVFGIRFGGTVTNGSEQQSCLESLSQILANLRVAGGSIIPPQDAWMRKFQPYLIDLTGTSEDRATITRKYRSRLLPGFALVSAHTKVEKRLAELQQVDSEVSLLQAWLSLVRINWHYKEGADPKDGEWIHDRSALGWLVPIPIGYGAISELKPAGSVTSARDQKTPFRLVESLYSIGEWVSPHRLSSFRQLMWYPIFDEVTGAYVCQNDFGSARKPEVQNNFLTPLEFE